MCPFCILTTAAIVSGSISAGGGLGAFLIGKAWAHGNAGQARAGAEASHLPDAMVREAAQPETPEPPRNR